MQELRDIGFNALFIWEMQPDYLHQTTDERDENGSLICNHVATMTNGTWRFHEPRSQNWNPYCGVRLKKVE